MSYPQPWCETTEERREGSCEINARRATSYRPTICAVMTPTHNGRTKQLGVSPGRALSSKVSILGVKAALRADQANNRVLKPCTITGSTVGLKGMAWIKTSSFDPSLFFHHHRHHRCRLSTSPPPRNDCPPEFPAHDKSQGGPAIPPGHSRVRQGKIDAHHPEYGNYAHRVGLLSRRTMSPPMLLNMELSMNCSISYSSADRTIPISIPWTRHTSSRTRSRVHKRTATRNFITTNHIPDSLIGKT